MLELNEGGGVGGADGGVGEAGGGDGGAGSGDGATGGGEGAGGDGLAGAACTTVTITGTEISREKPGAVS
jgi:hypothetical protein